MDSLKRAMDRRKFVATSAAITTSLIGLAGFDPVHASQNQNDEGLLVIGPIKGYDTQVGTLVSMLNYNRDTIIQQVKALTMPELDHLHDAAANTIGALILHLGATEKFYQINTFEGRQDFNDDEKKQWGAAMSLGDEGRQSIKGKEVKYYLDEITAVRNKTLQEFKNRDDKWLLAIDPEWSKERPLNTYWKWFHVCEHESNHRGQITWLKSRLPGATPAKD
jgi:uncharacterized damage-inducible protein DinB